VSLLPIVGPNVRVNEQQQSFPNGLLGRSETTIAANASGRLLVAGWNDAQGFCGAPFGVACTPPAKPGLSGYGYSTDGGLTWTDGGAPPVIGGVFTRGDPWLDSDGFTFYYANLSIDQTTGADLGVAVHRGAFNGNSFAWQDVRVFNSPNGSLDFYDKEAIVVGRRNAPGSAYVSVTNFQEICGQPQFGFGQIEVWRTHDFGNTWQGPAIAGPEAPDSVADCGNSGTLQQTSVPAIGANGEVYVVWQYGPFFFANGSNTTDAKIVVARSLDGGVTFEPFVTVADINSMRGNPPVGYNRGRINDHARIAVATSGPHTGRVFVTYYNAVSPAPAPGIVTCPPGFPTSTCFGQSLVSSQVYVSYSDDQGEIWSTPVPVAPAVPATGVKRFWPVVSVSPNGLKVDVVYYESLEAQATPNPTDVECNVSTGAPTRRVGAVSSLVDTYRTQSLNGGATFTPPVRVSSVTSNWCAVVSNITPNFGDYIGSTSAPNRTLPVWADGRNGMPDVFFAPVIGSSN
jgi:hypothetical protein